MDRLRHPAYIAISKALLARINGDRMKLARYGRISKEKPGLIDQEG
jgi:hypothetical protein